MKKNDIVYICSPLSAPTVQGIQKNMEKAAYYAGLVSGVTGCRAIAPHSFLPEYLDDSIREEREAALAFGLSILKLSKAIVVCGSRISSGMRGEIRLAGELDIPAYALIEGAGGAMLVRIKEADRLPDDGKDMEKDMPEEMKHIRVVFFSEDIIHRRDIFRSLDDPEEYFSRSIEDGTWHTAYPGADYCEKGDQFRPNIVFEITFHGKTICLDGNGDFQGKTPFVPFCHFQKALAEEILAVNPHLKDERARKEKLHSLYGRNHKGSHEKWDKALYFGKTEDVIREVSWNGRKYLVVIARCIHRPTGFIFRNYRFREERTQGHTSSHDLFLYDWDEQDM